MTAKPLNQGVMAALRDFFRHQKTARKQGRKTSQRQANRESGLFDVTKAKRN